MYSGEIKIISKRFPKELKVRTDFEQGYFSNTVNSFQLCKVPQGKWAGLEMLLFDGRPMPFSMVACTLVEVYKIDKANLTKKQVKGFVLSV